MIRALTSRIPISLKRLAARKRPRLRKPLNDTPDISGQRFLFIGGLHRSGTSILHRLLCEHPDASGFSGTGVEEDEGQHLQSVFPPARAFGGPGHFAFQPAASLMGTDPTTQDRDRLLREWGAYYDWTKPVLLEKSPPNLIRSNYFRALFPGSRFVFLVRHPICVALATRKWSKTSVIELVLHWTVAYRRMVEDCAGADDILVLRYEDMVAFPQYSLDLIAAHAGLAQFTPSEAVTDQNGHYLNAWLTENEAEAELLETAFPDVARWMEAFGYSLRPPFVSKIGIDALPFVRPPRSEA